MRVFQVAAIWHALLLPFLVMGAAPGPQRPTPASPSEADEPFAPKLGGPPAAPADHRIIIRYAGVAGQRPGAAPVLGKKVRELEAKHGVQSVKALERLGMVVVHCISQEAEEDLLEELEGNPNVDLAVPDTWFHADAAESVKGSGQKSSPQTQSDDADAEEVALKSYHGTYVSAEAWGGVAANREKMGAWEKFGLLHNSDGTISLRTWRGKYVAAESWGGVTAYHDRIGAKEKFKMISNKDGTISLKSHFGLYVSASLWAGLVANRPEIKGWEKFELIALQGPSDPQQRIPNDANFTKLWGMDSKSDFDIDAPEAWSKFTGEFSEGIVLGVIDTGIDYTHEDLKSQMWVNENEIPGNGIDDDGNGYIDDIHGADFANEDGDPFDDQMHGTHCAGTIAGIGNNGVGVAGVAWGGVKLMALKFLSASGSGRTSDAIKAIDYAVAHGAKILSNSWGGGGSSSALRVAIERAADAGILFIAAAGNSATNNDESPHYPSNYEASSVVSVAATNSSGGLSTFSCYGADTVDVGAPGSGIFSTVPGNGYASLSGTSMACPHVSGLAALVWMYRPSLTMPQVKEILMSSSTPAPALDGMCISGGRINAKDALAAASTFEPPHPPVHPPQGLMFEDTDKRVGVIGGTVTVTAAADESDVEYYKVYLVSGAGFRMDAIGRVAASGAAEMAITINGSISIPMFAFALIAVSGNATGEMPGQLGFLSPHVDLEDFGMPEAAPRAVAWGGDTDLRPGYVAGSVLVTRAPTELSITHYNVYWANATGWRGPLLGAVPAVGFVEPSCDGSACSLIQMGNTSDGNGIWYDRGESYGDGENAVISASGPGHVKVTRFNTEQYYDSLTVASRRLTGKPEVPLTVELPAGPALITWFSDSSINAAGGWRFELVQSGTEGELEVAATELHGQGVEVVPAFGHTELPKGTFAEITDYTANMPPSPAFAPVGITFKDLDTSVGSVAGVAKVTPSSFASDIAVTYYRVDFADAAGMPIGEGWVMREVVKGVTEVLVPIAATAVPAGAVQLIARAGNSFGLGLGKARVVLEDAVESPPENTSELEAAEDTLDVLKLQTQLRAAVPEPDSDVIPPPRAPPREPALIVWSMAAEATAELSGSTAKRGRVLGKVTVPGLDARTLGPRLREEVASAIAAGLPYVEGGVRILRVLAASGASARAAVPPGRQLSGAVERALGAHSQAATLEFDAVPAAGAPAAALDRIEARLILLSRGGRSAERFDTTLAARLNAAGAALPKDTRSLFGEAQQVGPRGRGRALAAAAALEAGERTALSGAEDEEAQGAVEATTIVVLLAAAAGVVAVVVYARRHLDRASKAPVTLEGVSVHLNDEGFAEASEAAAMTAPSAAVSG